MNNLYSKEWWKASLIRCIRTTAQTAVSLITVGAAMTEVNWITVVSVSLTSGIVSILTSIGGIPEVNDNNLNN